jgi:5'-3' exonuclease
MGIPSYFSYIVKNHREIIKKFYQKKENEKEGMTIDNLYLDCNSIIYDAVRSIDFTKQDVDEPQDIGLDSHQRIFRRVISKIEEYIFILGPTDTVIIAFDGVAPVAKLEQQRERRYKSWYQNEISKSIFKDAKPDAWNTTAITPGTLFMSELNNTIKNYFKKPANYNLKKLLVSTSDQVGEGEHKIFKYIRSNSDSHKDKVTVIYGLDADLIMLSINHLPICSNIYLFRETPEFIKSIDSSLEPNQHYMLNIPMLTMYIGISMNLYEVGDEKCNYKNIAYDYIFLCFLLGNDFMPHFPAVNIRTGGIDKLLNAYKATLGGTGDFLTEQDGKKIIWKNVRKILEFLAEREEEYFKEETKLRDRREKNTHYPIDTAEQKYTKFDAMPCYERELEKYVNPYKEDWQDRYYNALFKMDVDEERKKQICMNYLEGLEWTMKYYTDDCSDWRWSYKYHYPPLLVDLIRYTPYFDTELIAKNKNVAVTPIVQLSYVLPERSLSFLPEKLYNELKQKRPEWYSCDFEFIWAYTRYFWEAHVDLPEIDIDELEQIVASVAN